MYVNISVKTACTHDCEEETRVQEEKEIKNEGKQISWDKIHTYQTLPGKHARKTDSETEKSEKFKSIEYR